MCNTGLNTKIRYLREVFRRNGSNRADFNRAMYHKKKTTTGKGKSTGVAILPFQHTISYRISRLLRRFSIKTIHIPFKKISRMVRPVKDNLELKVSGVSSIPRVHGNVPILRTKGSIH